MSPIMYVGAASAITLFPTARLRSIVAVAQGSAITMLKLIVPGTTLE